jgi:hypothetical protein
MKSGWDSILNIFWGSMDPKESGNKVVRSFQPLQTSLILLLASASASTQLDATNPALEEEEEAAFTNS